MKDKPMCERCENEVLTTVDIWIQGQSYALVDGEYEPKAFELNSRDGRDYIVLCEPCWKVIHATVWALLCAATTVDHPKDT